MIKRIVYRNDTTYEHIFVDVYAGNIGLVYDPDDKITKGIHCIDSSDKEFINTTLRNYGFRKVNHIFD